MDICKIPVYNQLISNANEGGSPMTIRQLELFVQAYELRNLTHAGQNLFMTQSAATQNLKKTEEELGACLFERSTRQFVPTQAADCFYQHAKKIIVEYKNSLQDLAGLGEELTLYYFDLTSSAIKDSVISALWAIDPYLKINQKDCRMLELMSKPWIPGSLYLVPEEFISDPAVQSIDVAAVRHFIIMQDNHRLHIKDEIRPEDLEGETLLLHSDPEKESLHLRLALNQLSERNVHYRTSVADDVKELIPRILSFGGVAIVPEYLIRDVPGIMARPYKDGIAIHVKLAYKGSLQPRIKKLLTAFKKRSSSHRMDGDGNGI